MTLIGLFRTDGRENGKLSVRNNNILRRQILNLYLFGCSFQDTVEDGA